jgi:hypothetical protein
MKDDLRYTPSDCFETFPAAELRQRPERSKRRQGVLRFRDLAVRAAGLTATYNRFRPTSLRRH